MEEKKTEQIKQWFIDTKQLICTKLYIFTYLYTYLQIYEWVLILTNALNTKLHKYICLLNST